jgi:hypothetical protein
LQALSEVQASAYEQFEQRIFSQLVRELWDAEPALAGKVAALIDDLGWLEVPEGASRLTAAEANCVLGVLLRVVHRGVGASV